MKESVSECSPLVGETLRLRSDSGAWTVSADAGWEVRTVTLPYIGSGTFAASPRATYADIATLSRAVAGNEEAEAALSRVVTALDAGR